MQLTHGLYGATAYGYSQDADFITVGYSERQWQRVIDEFYRKYEGIREWHRRILQQVRATGSLTIPSGRQYTFTPKTVRGSLKWPDTQIKNYPVQGFGADLVLLARIEAKRLLNESRVEALMVQTIHDSIVVDTPSENVYTIGKLLQQAVEAVPALCKRHFNYDFSLPLFCEVQVGPNKRDLEDLIL